MVPPYAAPGQSHLRVTRDRPVASETAAGVPRLPEWSESRIRGARALTGAVMAMEPGTSSGGSPAGLSVGFVDDHPLTLRGFEDGLRELVPELTAVATAGTVGELTATAGHLDVVVLDLRLGDGSRPADNVRELLGRGWRVLLYTQETKPGVVTACLRAGAAGIVAKSAALCELAAAVRTVAAGGEHLNAEWAAVIRDDAAWRTPNLTGRENEVLALYATGLPLKSVARRVGVSENTAKEYLLRVRRKYAAAGRPAATKSEPFRVAIEDGIVPPPDVH